MTGLNPGDKLDWVEVREELNKDYATETVLEKGKRKVKENPLVPIGKLTYMPLNDVELVEPKAGCFL